MGFLQIYSQQGVTPLAWLLVCSSPFLLFLLFFLLLIFLQFLTNYITFGNKERMIQTMEIKQQSDQKSRKRRKKDA